MKLKYGKKQEEAFTLLELLVVIAIIGILVTISLLSLNPAQRSNETMAAKIAGELSGIKRAFELTAVDKARSPYPLDTSFGLGSNPAIGQLVANGDLSYVSEAVKPKLGEELYKYDNDGDSYAYLNNCPGSLSFGGANVVIYGINNADSNPIVLELDRIIDDSDGLNCGMIRTVNNSLRYNLSANS